MNEPRTVKPTQGSRVVARFLDGDTGITAEVSIVVKVDPDTTEQWSSELVSQLLTDAVNDNVEIYTRGRK